MSAQPPKAKNSCTYSYFDPETFEPLNEDTRLRLLEVDFQKADFEGNTVLDIGCNSGLLSFTALLKGAKSVKAIDVQPVLVDYVQGLLDTKDLPMTVSLKPFHLLDEQEDQADIVLFFEVIHWLAAQGRSIRDVITKVAGLTRKKLFMEFPWSVREPSIKVQTDLTHENYDASLILDELNKHFETVKIERFMHYFGYGNESVRVLITAEGRKFSGRLLSHIPDLTGFERTFDWGRNRSRYVLGRSREYLVKRIAPESRLRLLEPELMTQLFDELSTSEPKVLSLPIKLDEGYIFDLWDEEGMAFDWLGEPMEPGVPHWRIPITDHVHLACQVTRQMSHLESETISALRNSKFFAPLLPQTLMKRFTETSTYHGLLPETIQPWVDAVESLELSDYSHLVHGDLNTSNILLLSDDSLRVVDLDNVSLGSPLLDILFVPAMRGSTLEEMTHYLTIAERVMGDQWPSLTRRHIIFPIYLLIGWLYSIYDREGEDPSTQTRNHVNIVVQGLQSLLQLGESLDIPVR